MNLGNPESMRPMSLVRALNRPLHGMTPTARVTLTPE